MCVLFGTDYLQRLRHFTVNMIFDTFVISNCDLLEYVKKISENMKLPENYMESVYDVKYYYANASVIDPTTIDVKLKLPAKYGLTLSKF